MFSELACIIDFISFVCACWIDVACETTCRCIKPSRESTHGKQTETDQSCDNMCEHVHPIDSAFQSCPTNVNQERQTCYRKKNATC